MQMASVGEKKTELVAFKVGESITVRLRELRGRHEAGMEGIQEAGNIAREIFLLGLRTAERLAKEKADETPKA